MVLFKYFKSKKTSFTGSGGAIEYPYKKWLHHRSKQGGLSALKEKQSLYIKDQKAVVGKYTADYCVVNAIKR